MLRFIVFLVSVLILSSCVYFNMFFNGREHFEEGEEKLKETGKVEKSSYNNSIKELSKILEFYPEDDMVDDALLLIGRAYYRLENYLKSRRKFQELITNYPESELVPKAKIWLSEVEIKLGDYDAVDKLLSDIKPDSTESEGMKTYLRIMGDLKLTQKDSIAAKDFYLKAANYESVDSEREELIKIAALIAESKKLYKEADRNYLEASEITDSRELMVYYLLKHGEMLQARGLTDSAKGIYNEMLDNSDLERYYPNIEFNLAKINFLAKDYDKAFDRFNYIVKNGRKGDGQDSILAESSYYIGEYLLTVKKDVDNAYSYFDSVSYFYTKGESREKSVNRSKSIFNRNFYKESIEDTKFSLDSLKEDIDEMVEDGKSEDDTTDYDLTLKLMRVQAKKYEKRIANGYYKIGDIFVNELSLPDSAIGYLDEGKEYTTFPHIASKCEYLLYSIFKEKNIDDKLDSLKSSIVTRFPHTKAANFVRAEKGLEPVIVIEDTLKHLYNQASDYVIDEEYEKADKVFTELIDRSIGYDIYPQVLLSAAYLNENYTLDRDKALQYYAILKKDHWKKSEGIYAKNKLRTSDEPIEKVEVKEEVVELDEFEKWRLMDRRVR